MIGISEGMCKNTFQENTLPDPKQDYSLTYSLRMIYNRSNIKAGAIRSLPKWYNKMAENEFMFFNTNAATVYERHDEIFNFFINRNTGFVKIPDQCNSRDEYKQIRERKIPESSRKNPNKLSQKNTDVR